MNADCNLFAGDTTLSTRNNSVKNIQETLQLYQLAQEWSETFDSGEAVEIAFLDLQNHLTRFGTMGFSQN